jgi:hypothetical protein
VGQPGEPFAAEGVDLGRAQVVADALEAGRVRAREKAVVEGFEVDAGLGGLALGEVMPVETELGGIGEESPELDEEGAEVTVKAVAG